MMRSRTLRLALILVTLAGGGCVSGGRLLIRRANINGEWPSPPAPQKPEISWAVRNAFRLVKPPATSGESEYDLLARYNYYYRHVNRQIVDENNFQPAILKTFWNEAASAYDAQYLPITIWDVDLDAGVFGQCDWEVSGATTRGPCRHYPLNNVSPGTVVKVKTLAGVEAKETLSPRDVLIASLGDSYASGEGVPDIRASKIAAAQWTSKQCHRSLFAAPSLAAMMYSRLNPHVSVTHVSFACSGAILEDAGTTVPCAKDAATSERPCGGGILTPYSGAIPEGKKLVPPQIKALEDLLNASGRTPEILTISIGGNDVGFGRIVDTGIVPFEKNQFAPAVAAVVVERKKFEGEIAQLAQHLQQPLFKSTSILVTGYPDPTKGRDGPCLNVFPFLSFSLADIEQISTKVIPELEEMEKGLAKGITTSEYLPVGGYEGHGFCGRELTEGDSRWLNRLADGSRIGGGPCYAIKGTMHPNIRGQDAAARVILDGMKKAECALIRKDDDFVQKTLCEPSVVWSNLVPKATAFSAPAAAPEASSEE